MYNVTEINIHKNFILFKILSEHIFNSKYQNVKFTQDKDRKAKLAH